MKSIALFLALAVVSAAFAGPAKSTPKTLRCCVMPADQINVAEATKAHHYVDYKGNRYFFCCDDCPKLFKKNPEKYLKGDHIKTPASKPHH